MAAYEMNTPRWGSNRSNQLAASKFGGLGDNETVRKIVTESYTTAILGRTKTRTYEKYVGQGQMKVTNDSDVGATRKFYHRCGLLKLGVTASADGPAYFALFEGHNATNFDSGGVEIRFAPDELLANDGNPIAEVWYKGEGARDGPLRHYTGTRLICTFADKAQMERYLDTGSRRVSTSLVHEGKTYTLNSDGQYQSDDGSLLVAGIALALMFGGSEAAAGTSDSSGAIGIGGVDTGVADTSGVSGQ
jgi:hypothetical protein